MTREEAQKELARLKALIAKGGRSRRIHREIDRLERRLMREVRKRLSS